MSSDSIFPTRLSIEYTPIHEIVELYAGDHIDLRPSYQRPIRWNKTNMLAFIAFACMGGYMKTILLYTFMGDDERKNAHHLYECMDGQHRIFVLSHFMGGIPVSITPDCAPFMITWQRRNLHGEITNVFYEENEHTREWIRTHPSERFDYMSSEERELLKNKTIPVERTLDRLTYDQRALQFVGIQEGKPVKNSDKLKNMIGIDIIRYLRDKGYEALQDISLKRLTTKPQKYWVHWEIRKFLMAALPVGKTVLDGFLYTDSQIAALVNHDPRNPMLKVSEGQASIFWEATSRFTKFLASLPSTLKLAPCMYFALFAYLCTAPVGAEDVLWAWMPEWCAANEEQSKVWESKKNGGTPEARKEFFNSNLEELKGYAEAEFEAKAARKKLSKKVRMNLYVNAFKDIKEPGTCFCCHGSINYANFEAGHILAQSNGGPDTLDNLRAICKTCNCRMGTMHMLEYCNKFYPHKHMHLI